MSHYQHQYYQAPPPAAPIPSSFYAARQHFKQQAQATTSAPPHLRQNAYQYQQHPAPPRHPLSQARAGEHHQPVGQPGPSQRHSQPQFQQSARPQSQYGQVQQYQPPYVHVQSQPHPSQHAVPYAPQAPAQYAPQSSFSPAQYAQKMYDHTHVQSLPQAGRQSDPAQASAWYEAYNARMRSAAASQPPPQPQQQPPPSILPQSQYGYPTGAAQASPSVVARSGPILKPQISESHTTVGSRRPLPQPGASARPRPLSMPPQMQSEVFASRPNGFLGHSSSSSLSNILPQTSAVLTPSLPSPLASVPSASSAPAPTPRDVPRTTFGQPGGRQSPEKAPASTEAITRTPTQRRALPKAPTAPPDLSNLQQRRSMIGTVSAPLVSKPSPSIPISPHTASQVLPPLPSLNSDTEDDKLSISSQASGESRQDMPSPQYGILDLPKRNPQIFGSKSDPPSPQYGIKDLPSRAKSVVDRRKAWERVEQGMNEAQARPNSSSPTKRPVSKRASTVPAVGPVAPARSPQPQMPQRPQKLPMPVVRQPQPSRTERTPSWTLPTADLEKIAAKSISNGEQKSSMALRFAQMSLDEEKNNARPAKQQALPPITQQQRPAVQSSNSSPSTSTSPTKPYQLPSRTPRRRANMDLNLDDAPPPSLRRTPSPSASTASSSVPSIPAIKTPEDPPQKAVPMIPQINLPGGLDLDDVSGVKVQVPSIAVSPAFASPKKAGIPTINIPDEETTTGSSGPTISVSAPSQRASSAPMPVILDDLANSASQAKPRGLPRPPSNLVAAAASASSSSNPTLRSKRGGLVCGGCNESIIGRIVSAMSLRWHPQCFKCCTCGEQLEHVSSYEHDGKPYCHLDYHELFAPQCYSCKTPIIDERFITLDDPALGKRTYHEQHFFCAECGDPFLAPSLEKASKRSGPNEINIKGDGAFDVAVDEDGEEVGFTVFRGHPYCEACHVRLRAPKCKGCKRSIRDGMRAVEALGGKWCYECFVCAGCQKPFEEPSFFQRGKKPFCEHCFSIILRNEV